MRIGIDSRFLTHPQPGGFKTYTENLVTALAEVDTENEYLLYIDRPPEEQHKLPAQENFSNRVVSGSVSIIGMPWREQVGLALRAAKDRIDVFHSPCLTAPLYLNCPLVITIHDMIWAFPERFSKNGSLPAKRKLMEWYNRVIPRFASRRASAIITVSHAAKESIVEHLKLGEDQVYVTLEAPNPLFRRIVDEQCIENIRCKYDLPSHFILAIGSADPRKNINRLVLAYSRLSNELQAKYQLVIVWTHSLLAGELSEQIEKLRLTRNVRFLEHVSNDELVLIYNSASLFAFPSLYEGFGLPPLEAMACGVPVIAANNSSIPEIVGDAALLFDALNTEEIAATMNRVLTDDLLRTALRPEGLKRASDFSWEECARQTINVYESVLK